MATLAVVTFGFLAAGRLPVDLLPDLSYPTLTIQTEYTDAAPVSVEQFVTRPVEEAVGVIPGVREMRSTSRAGSSEVVLEFDWEQPMDFAALDVREKLGLVELPREAGQPRVLRFDPSLEPVMRFAFTGDRPLDELRELADRWLKQRLESVRGVAAVKVRGGYETEIHVDADEARLAALGIPMSELARALEAENVNVPGGTLRDFNAVYLVRTMHEFTDLEQLRRTVVRQSDAGTVRIEDVAEVTRGHRERTELSRLGGRETVELALHREGSANTVQVARAVRAEVAELGSEIPPGLELVTLADQARYIEQAVGEVWSAAIVGGVLAIAILYFFLRDPASTGIIALSIPISVLATFLPMGRAGVSLNIMSLGGLALGVGMLVDNSIVVLEAIDRRRREGLARARAAVVGAGEVAGAVTASTLTTISVFFPIVFVRGVAGQLFYDQAVTVCFSLLASLFVSLTLIPAFAAFDPATLTQGAGATLFRWDRADDGPTGRGELGLGGLVMPAVGDGRHLISRTLTWGLFPVRGLVLVVTAGAAILGQLADRAFGLLTLPLAGAFERVRAGYPGLLRRALRRRALVLLVAMVLLGLSVWATRFLGTELVPDLSQGEFAFRLDLPEGTPLTSTAEIVGEIEGRLAADPRFARVFSVVGSLPSSASGRRTLGENLAQLDLALPPGADRDAEQDALLAARHVLAGFPKVEAELVAASSLSMRPPIAIQIFDDDLATLDQGAERVARVLATVPGTEDVASTSEPGSPEVRIELQRERASSLGVTAEAIGALLRTKIRGDVVGQLREGEDRYDIRLRAGAAVRERASELAALRIPVAGGDSVPLSAVANVEVDMGPAAIHRVGGARMAEVTAKVSSRRLGETLDAVGRALAGVDLPRTSRAEMAGQDRELEVSFSSLRLAMGLAVFLVYVVMAAQFESLLHPLVILVSVPLGVVGIVAALLLTGRPIGVLGLIGAVMLAGIVVNNAIVLIDAVNRRRREGEEVDEALVEAGSERLRPILMTTLTTVLGLLPMALGIGAGGELRAPLAITVIGGLSVATVLTLVVIPCLYRALTRNAPRPDPGGP